MKKVILIGYSGHAFVATEILLKAGRQLEGYMEPAQKYNNPFNLEYLGDDSDSRILNQYKDFEFFVSIGENQKRSFLIEKLTAQGFIITNAIHPQSFVFSYAKISSVGVMISANVSINALAQIGDGVICNSGCIIEHECKISNYVHVCPGAILCGNVEVGECSFVGAGTVIKERIKIGSNVIIGAGTVVVKNVPDNAKIIGNPQRQL